MESKLKRLFSEVLGVPESKIQNDSSPESLEQWDSLNHMNLILALEQEFNVTFTPDEMIELLNFELIKKTLTVKLNDN